MEAHKKLVFAIVEYLQDIINPSNPISADVPGLDTESIEVAIQCLSSSFGIDTNNEDQKTAYSIRPSTLPAVFGLGLTSKEELANAITQQLGASASTAAPAPAAAKSEPEDPEFAEFLAKLNQKNYFAGHQPGTPEYQTRYEKAKSKFYEAKTQQPAAQPQKPKQEQLEQAEKLKTEGNALLGTDPTEAIAKYTQAIELNPDNAIYYCNRAVAHCKLGNYEAAVKDGLTSLEKDPNYSKAYGRLGIAYFHLKQFDESEKYYKKALELDPNNPTYTSALQEISAQKSGAGANRGGLDFASLLNNPALRQMGQQFAQQQAGAGGAGAGAGAGAGGMPNLSGLDINGLMNDPNLSNMVGEMMQNPQIAQMAQNIMSNPAAMQQMMSLFGNPNAPK